MRTWLNKSQIEDWFGLWHIFPPFSFKWNDVVSCTVKKKKPRDQNDAVLNGIVTFLLPLDGQNKGRRRFFLPLFSPTSLPQKHQKDADHSPTCITFDPWPPTGRWKKEGTCPSGSCGAATQWLPQPRPSPVFAYKNRGQNKKKRGTREWRTRTEENRGEDRKNEKKKERDRRIVEKEENRGRERARKNKEKEKEKK